MHNKFSQEYNVVGGVGGDWKVVKKQTTARKKNTYQ
jgi:hypothetical protein